MSQVPSVHSILAPTVWPNAPTAMTFSTLRAIEGCPRRWALSHGQYPELWDRDGYPPRPSLPAMTGAIQHNAVELVLKAFSKSQVPSGASQEAVEVLRELGGFATVLRECLEHELSTWTDNPRAVGMLGWLRQQLDARLPGMRQQVQVLLSRIPAGGIGRVMSDPTGSVGSGAGLPLGIYVEQWLNHPTLLWKGKADLLILSSDGVAIVDFKTGEAKPEHSLQLQVYSLLWARDRRLNPSGRVPTLLLLCYGAKTMEVPILPEDQLNEFEQLLAAKTEAVQSAVNDSLPRAVPGIERCPYCPVRHLCGSYWTAESRKELCLEAGETRALSNDYQIRLLRQQNARQWDVRVESSLWFPDENQAILRLSAALGWLRSGMRLRIVMASTRLPARADRLPSENTNEDSVLVITQNAWTELYVVQEE